MIFVTVGTHEQPFNRLIEEIDNLVAAGEINEEVIIQYGYSTYQIKNCKGYQLIPFQDMIKNVQNARIVITHGGPASFIMPLQFGKIPIVVPRQKQYNEHVNNHQLEFSAAVAKRFNNIIVVENVEELSKTIKNYETICKNLSVSSLSNNEKFNSDLKNIINSLFNEEK